MIERRCDERIQQNFIVPRNIHENSLGFTENPLRNDEIPHRFLVILRENVIKGTHNREAIPPVKEPAPLRLAA